ncbi:MAG: MBL fold metallo-hydrolase [Lachnospiraceae bacterium]
MAAKLTEEGVTPKAILLTHGHRDHIGAVPELRKHYGIPVYVGAEDQEMLGDADKNLSTGLFGKPMTLQADQLLKDKDQLELAGFSIQVFHTPGHTPGGCCFYFPEEQVLFSGDTLFCGSVGRTDFPGEQLRTGDFRASSSEGTSGRDRGLSGPRERYEH